jgi:hypothetical protein
MGTLEAHEFQAGWRIRLDASSGSSGFGLNPFAASRPFGFDPLRREMCPEIQAAEWSPTPSPRCSVNSGQLRGTHSEKLPFLVCDSSVLNQLVEAAKFLADALRCVGNRNPVSHVELERDGARPDLPASTVRPSPPLTDPISAT